MLFYEVLSATLVDRKFRSFGFAKDFFTVPEQVT